MGKQSTCTDRPETQAACYYSANLAQAPWEARGSLFGTFFRVQAVLFCCSPYFLLLRRGRSGAAMCCAVDAAGFSAADAGIAYLCKRCTLANVYRKVLLKCASPNACSTISVAVGLY